MVDAAKTVGIDIPVFCYHPKMEPVGMCRMCLVEIGRPLMDRNTGKPMLDDKGKPKIQFGPKLETACTNSGLGGHGGADRSPRRPRPGRRARSSSCSPRTRWTARSATRAASVRCRT